MEQSIEHQPLEQVTIPGIGIIHDWVNHPGSKPMSLTKPKMLTRDLIKERCNQIINHVEEIDLLFYWWSDEDGWNENSAKWKTYVYLRKCLLDYENNLPHEELTLLIQFLETNTREGKESNKAWLSKRLIDPPNEEQEEYWGSGQHEWLERSLILDVLKRSAGMVEGVESKVELGCIWGDVDWLYIQATCRSADKYISFKKISPLAEPHSVFFSGHPGNIKRDLTKRGFATEGSYHFHKELVEAFYHSDTIVQFVKQVINIYRSWLISGRKPVDASTSKRYLPDGTETDNFFDINAYRINKHKPNYKAEISTQFKVLFEVVSKHGYDDDDKLTLIDSDSSDSEDEKKVKHNFRS